MTDRILSVNKEYESLRRKRRYNCRNCGYRLKKKLKVGKVGRKGSKLGIER